jgi:DNA-binding NtrC family response regulator
MASDFAASVLLAESDPAVGRAILAYLADRRYAVEWVEDGEKAHNLLDSRLFDVLVAELNGPRVEGMRLMKRAKDRNPEICVVFIIEKPDIELATEAMRHGAYDFQIKPVNFGKLEAVIQRGLDHQRLVYRQHELRRRLDEHYGLGSLVGNSRQMVRVYNAVRQAAPLSTPVLIQGEPGTGKDLIAHAIHNNSPRRDEPFVKVQCGGAPEEAVDAALFGYAAGAIPGSSEGRPGRIELADHGTLYLDEVGELTPVQQERLAELVRRRKTARLGGGRPLVVDVRVVAATTRPIDWYGFDPDLARLLQSAAIEAPALRDRREDIPLLVQHMVREASEANGLATVSPTRHAMDLLMRYDWPENVRELKNIVEGMVLAARGARRIDVNDVPDYVRRSAKYAAKEIRLPIGASMDEIEQAVIEETMKACGFNKEACAKTLGIGLRTLYRKLKQYDIR